MFKPKKIIIWGYKLDEHTHSYTHYAFHKTFKAMGYETYWVTNNSDISGIDLSGSLFITEGQVDQNIPLRNDCIYALHNPRSDKYAQLKKENILQIKVYLYSIEKYKIRKINDGAYVSEEGNLTLYQPWATHLLPEEINLDDIHYPRKKEIHWCGTYGAGLYGNIPQLDPFFNIARKNGYSVQIHGPCLESFERVHQLTKESYLAPAIHGSWQVENGYIACRTFKNISLGHLMGTNNRAAYNLLNQEIVYNPDTEQLFYDMQKEVGNIERIKKTMMLVRDKHTFINRCQNLLSVL